MMSDDSSLEMTLVDLGEKLHLLNSTTNILKSKKFLKDELLEMQNATSFLSRGISNARNIYEEMKMQNNRCKELLSLLKVLDTRIIQMEKHLAPELLRQDGASGRNGCHLAEKPSNQFVSTSPTEDQAEEQENPAKDCKRILCDEPDVCPTMSPITEDEYSKVPKYIIGRQSLETVNGLINTVNQVLKAKYTLLSMGRANARKQGDFSLYLHYKKQEMDVCEGNEYLYFFTGEDYERHTKTKLNKTKLNLLIVLRHCKRLREYRAKNDLRYIVVSKQW